MKLSQKLLGLAGVALADYACCPYDDYGLPDSACTSQLREKTPFATSDQTFQQNDCKAWEFNADAIFDGNDKCSINRGQCGFQRQFAWGAAGATSSPATNAFLTGFGIDNTYELSFGLESSAATVAGWDPVLGTSNYATSYGSVPANHDTRSNSNGWGIGRAPRLGAVCKLFVPVPPKHVVQVQVAGVHKNAGILTMLPAQFKATSSSTAVDGSVFCFSVVNPSEGDVNSNGVGNGNVNGVGPIGALPSGDDFNNKNSLERQAGVAPARAFDDYLVGTASTLSDASNDQNNSNGGNFDVVAHFSSAWCTRNLNIVEMQQAGDYNNGDSDYQIAAGTNAHAHNDIVDKRFAPASPATGSEYGGYTLTGATSGYMRNANSGSTTDFRWPNQGAWAGYHSVVTCAQYDTGSNGFHVWASNTRDYVMSVSGQDFRQGSSTACTGLNYRFNVRQVGSAVANCGPGQLPDNDNKRCTWNWNYENSPTEPESFFDRTDNLVFETWTRRRRAVVSHANADLQTNAAKGPVLKTVNFAFAFKDGLGNALTTTHVTGLSADASSYVAVTGLSAAMTCSSGHPASTPYRDNFPDCFFGDEVHFDVEYTAPDSNTDKDVRSRINSWLSTVTVTTSSP